MSVAAGVATKSIYNMPSMFERCTETARRAIFFARALAVLSEAPQITSVDLLAALLWDDKSRAQSLFNLRDRFPLYCGCPHKFAKLPKPTAEPLLDDRAKQCLRWTAQEATQLGDYWIDNEHLLLGIIRVRASTASSYLAMIGLTVHGVRKIIQDNKHSRPDYGPIPRWWRIKSRLLRLMVLGKTT